MKSLLSWERGLKLKGRKQLPKLIRVAPIVGAWIEILSIAFKRLNYCGRSYRGSVD